MNVSKREVVIEMSTRDSRWRRLGGVAESDRLGSLSSCDPAGRQVLLFGWVNGRPGVWRSVSGVDVTEGDVREVMTTALEALTDLRVTTY